MPGPFFFFAALVGLTTLVMAIRFLIHPSETALSVIRPLTAATAFSSLAAFFLGVANGLYALRGALERAADAAASAQVWRMFLGGLAESPAALILGFAILSVTWLLVAVGMRRSA